MQLEATPLQLHQIACNIMREQKGDKETYCLHLLLIIPHHDIHELYVNVFPNFIISYLEKPNDLYVIVIIIMGLSESANVIANRWAFVERVGSYSIVRDKSGREGEEYEIPVLAQAVPEQQFKIYNMRKSSPHQIVAVYGSQFLSQPVLCSGSASLRVITEHLCIRFCESFSLSIQEVLYALTEAVRGFAFLYCKVGCFQVTDRMVGLTAEGELRVWFHQKFGQNSPQLPKNSITAVSLRKYNGVNREESAMIKQVFQVVEQHAQMGLFEKYFNRIRLQAYSFQTISTFLVELRAKYGIPCALRIDIAKKGSNFVI